MWARHRHALALACLKMKRCKDERWACPFAIEAADISKTVALADGLLLASTAWPAAPPHRHAEEADRYEVLAAQRTTQFHILLAVHASLWSRRGLAARLRPCVRCEEAKEAECNLRKQVARVSDVGFRQACCAGKVWAGAPVNPSSQSAAVLSPLPVCSGLFVAHFCSSWRRLGVGRRVGR